MEKRLRFIRSKNPFKGLDDYRDADELRVNNSQIEYPLQLSFDGFDRFSAAYGLRVRLGYYFELLTQGIYGGRLKGCHQLLNNTHENNTIDNHGIVTSEPDVVFDEKSCLRESKSVSLGESLKIDDVQLAKYVSIQLGDYFQNPPKIIFDIFRHGVRELVNGFGQKSLENLVDALSSSTRFMISAPLSVIVSVHKKSGDASFGYASRYEEGEWEHNSRLLSSGLNAMLAYPEKTLLEFGLSPDDYNIWKLKFPTGVEMNKKEIRPFPVLLIRDKNHREWVESFKEKGQESYPKLFELRHRRSRGNNIKF